MNTPMDPSILLHALPILMIVGILFLVMRTISKTRQEIKLKEQQQQQLIQDKNATLYATFPHVAGLQLPEDTLCEVFSCPDHLEISANGIDFKLSKSKIHDITSKTDVEIQKQYVSSAAGAVAGSMLFGSVGALIGGRVKEKKSKTVCHYMIISYSKDDAVDYIAFDTTNNPFQARKFINEFKTRPNTTSRSVEL